jgi:hypothetical protein
MKIGFDLQLSIDIPDCKLKSIIPCFHQLMREFLKHFIQEVLVAFGERYHRERKEPFKCENCGNGHHFSWKTKHGKETRIVTELIEVLLRQLQVQCKNCGHKFYITRKLLGIEPRRQMTEETMKKLALIGSLTTFRVSAKLTQLFGWVFDKMTVWRSVQQVGKEMKFDLDPDELAEGQADGTGVGIQGIKKRGKELKVFVQLKHGGGVRVAGVSIGNYDGGWDKLFGPLVESIRKMGRFLLVTDGDTHIFDSLKGKVQVVLQRCLWHIPHQLKYCLWKDGVQRKSGGWLHALAEALNICAIREFVEDAQVIEKMISLKREQLDKLIWYCESRDWSHSAVYLTNARPNMFTSLRCRLRGQTTSLVERVMRTANMRTNVGKWSIQGALNAMKIRLAHYYNGFDVEQQLLASGHIQLSLGRNTLPTFHG